MQSERHDGPAGGGTVARNRPLPSKPVGSFLPGLVREACRRRGFSNIDIVLRWHEIVGPALAEETWPVRIDWPRRQEAQLRPDGTAAPGGQRTRLVVAAAPARALEVEYAKREIVERVNRYLGYRAATELAATPDYAAAPDRNRKQEHGAQPARSAAPNDAQTAADDDPLRAALARLGRGVAARGY
jgi:hypothetical protein